MSKSKKMYKNTFSHNDSISPRILPLWKYVSIGQMYVQETWKFRQSYYAKFEVYGDKEVWKLTHDQR
jgi:hypothetical protein